MHIVKYEILVYFWKVELTLNTKSILLVLLNKLMEFSALHSEKTK